MPAEGQLALIRRVFSFAIMKDAYYFSHDYNARNDEKILKLIQKEGWIGYGIYWAIIEKLYEAGGFLEKDYECIAFDLRTECERIQAVIESGLFEFSNEKFYSKSCLARLKTRKGKSEKARQSAFLRWNKPNKDNANALRTQSEGNAIKERKGKERKDIHTPSDFVSCEYIGHLRRDNRRDLRIIGLYFEEAKMEFPSKEAADKELKRWLKTAKTLKDYSDEKILKAFKVAKQKHKELWKLSTVEKEIPSVK
jgi:hypothetical protein